MKKYVSPHFMSRCESSLIDSLARIGHSLSNRTETKYVKETAFGQPESTCIHALISATEVEVYIYDDGANISGPSADYRVEWEDYDNETELIEGVIQKALYAINGRTAS